MNGFEIGTYIFCGVVFGLLIYYISLKIINQITFGPRSTPKAKIDPLVNKSKIKILQYNVFWRPNIVHLNHKEYSTERSKELLKVIDEYDILCLDEAFAYIGSPLTDFIKAARAKGFVYLARSEPCEIFSLYVIDSGVLILSKLPILSSDSIVYTLGCGSDMFMRKGAVYAKIQTSPNSHINLFATNLQSNYVGGELDTRTVRNQQLRELLAFIRRTSIDSYPILIAGNLNINANNKTTIGKLGKTEYDRIWNNLQLDQYSLVDLSYENENSSISHSVTFGEDEKYLTPNLLVGSNQCIDYIMLFRYENGALIVDNQRTTVEKMETNGKHPYTHISNHYALKCELELKHAADQV